MKYSSDIKLGGVVIIIDDRDKLIMNSPYLDIEPKDRFIHGEKQIEFSI